MSLIPLGPYDLLRLLGRGGMAEVWQAVHRGRDIPVAIKVFTGRGARTPRFRASFRNEARALAGLDHPNISAVLDFGEIGAEVERAADGRLRAGEPFLVMELAGGGAITPLVGKLSWPEVRWVLLELLEALAHAHARGVIHRDLKPDNVLVGTGLSLDEGPALSDESSLLDIATDPTLMSMPGTGSGIKLSDFGLAVATDNATPGRGAEGAGAAGTPAYMAPEQIAGAWRDYGPWTDLYSLGCLAWALTTGKAPFSGLSVSRQVDAHQRRPPPPLIPNACCDVPVGFEGWLARLLAKAPAARFRRAADAAWSLRQLSPHDGCCAEAQAISVGERLRLARYAQESTRERPTLQLSEVSFASATWAEIGEARETEDPLPSNEVALRLRGTPLWSPSDARDVPPLPVDWRAPEGTAAPHPLIGAGIALFGLRTVPLVDRESERDTLWSLMRQVHRSGRARVAVLQGPSGCGKSRLARWICERAHELGAAGWLRAIHSPTGGTHTGLGAMVGRFLRVAGQEPAALALRVEELFEAWAVEDPTESAALCELVSPGFESDGVRAIRFETMDERVVVAARFLQRLSTERPLVVWLDDAQWGLEALHLVEQMITRADEAPAPVLLVLTVADEALAERPNEGAALARVLELAGVTRVAVGPLPAAQRLTLVHEILGLESDLAAAVAVRTGGNPLFAVQLVGDWVERGWLVSGRGGYRLRGGVTAELPDDLRKVWETRVARLLEGRDEAQAVALELAATLGQQVEGAEWAVVCQLAGIAVPAALVEVLLDERLANAEDGDATARWAFVHEMLRESILNRAAAAGRLALHHRRCADMLHARLRPHTPLLRTAPSPADEWIAARVGRHLLAGGELAASVGPLLQGAWERGLLGDQAQAEALLADCDRAIEAAGLPDSDARHGEMGLVRAWFLARTANPMAAEELLFDIERRARVWGWDAVLARALYESAWLLQDRGENTIARDRLEEARALAEKLGEPALRSGCERYLCRLLLKLGAIDEATRHGLAAFDICTTLGDNFTAAGVLILLGDCANWAAQPELATERVKQASDYYERSGSRWGMAQAANTLGEIARMRGQFAEAEHHYRMSLDRYRAVGSVMAVLPYVNLGLVAIELGEHARALPMLERGLSVLERQGLRPFAVAVHLALLAPTADARDWPAFDRHLMAATAMLDETGAVDIDNARLSTLAAGIARAAGAPDRARAALRVAHDQWVQLGRTEEAAAVAAELESLS